MFILRFDMRAPACDGAQLAARYETALEMAAWGERNGCIAVTVHEHHAIDDGYLPVPLILATAIAARTSVVPIQVGALLLPLYEPVRLAEEMAVLDLLSRGRVSYVLGMGYRPEEYEMFGVPMRGRGERMERSVAALRQAWTGETFEHEGCRVRVTPRPFTSGGPLMLLGGNSAVTARRAARLGVGFNLQSDDPTLEEIYLAECAALGREPGAIQRPRADIVTCTFIAEDVEEAWREIGPCMLTDARTYRAWARDGAARAVGLSAATSVEELRAERGGYRIFTPDEAVSCLREQGLLVLHPLCCGTPIARAWQTLELLVDRVLPAARG